MARRGFALFVLLAFGSSAAYAAGPAYDSDAVAGQMMDAIFEHASRHLLRTDAESAPPDDSPDDGSPPAGKYDESKYLDKIKEYFKDALEYIKEKTDYTKDRLTELVALQKKAAENAKDMLQVRLAEGSDKLAGAKTKLEDSKLSEELSSASETLRARLEEQRLAVGDRLAGLGDALSSGADKLKAKLEDRKVGEALAGAADKLRLKFEDQKLAVGDFLESVLGKGYEKHLPPFLLNDTKSMDWSKLASKDFSSTLAGLASGDFSLANLTAALKEGEVTLGDLYNNLQTVETRYCTPESYARGDIVPTGCAGASVAIQLVPRYCQLDDVQLQVVCEPAKLALQYFPASCNLKYRSNSVWTGKRCRISGNIGSTRTAVLGGRTFNVVLSDFSNTEELAANFDKLVSQEKSAIKDHRGGKKDGAPQPEPEAEATSAPQPADDAPGAPAPTMEADM